MARRSLRAFLAGLQAQIAAADADVQAKALALEAATQKRDALAAILDLPELQGLSERKKKGS